VPDLFHPIQVAIDGNEANQTQQVGSNTYARGIITAMAQLTATSRRNFHLTILLSQPPQANLPPPRSGLTYKVIRPAPLWTQNALPWHLFWHQRDYDVFFTPGHYAPRWCSIPYVSSVMDVAFLPYPELFRTRDLWQLRQWTRYSVRHASKVVAISKFTKNEIMRYYGRAAQDVIVAYPALDFENLPLLPSVKAQRICLQLGIKHNFYLYLGTLQPRKNILRLIDAFANFAKTSRQTFNLVLAGKNGWLTDEIYQKIAQSPVRELVCMPGFVTKVQKAALLQCAIATLNLGFYEGFGLPALESLAYQTLPIIANNTSLPEAAGGAALSVNPYKISSITKAMLLAANLPVAQRRKFNLLAQKQLAKFSYTKSANLILTTLQRLVN
jgi:glycosyltransferase involved in cell wall biosynthesis